MEIRVLLVDLDRPEEPLTVALVHMSENKVTVAVPNTSVSFNLWRRNGEPFFEGTLGGRYYTFDPEQLKSRSSPPS